MNKKKTLIIALAAVVAAGGGTAVYVTQFQNKPKKNAAAAQTTVKVTKGNLRATITGTAQLEAQQLQMIVPPKDGMIKTINLTRNQPVKKGDLLLELTDTSLEEKLDSAKISLNQYQTDLKDLQAQAGSLKTTAPQGGKLILAGNLSEGSNVTKTTKIATIADVNTLLVTLPFVKEEAAQVKQGDLVEITADGFLLSKVGTVESIAAGTRADASGNRLSDIIVRIENDGTLDAETNVQGTIATNGLKIKSKGTGKLQYQNSTTVFAGVSGSIGQLHIKETRSVRAGELIATIVNDSLAKDTNTKQQQIDQQTKIIEDLESQLAGLVVVAPFDGVFSTDFADPKKNVLSSYPVGTTIKSTVQLGAVASLDTLQLPISVDELDLPKIKVGQKAQVRVDAISGKAYEAEVTQVSTVGTVSNGVTTYSVTLSMKSSPELKYAMTASADIIIEDKRDVLMLPIEAVQSRGNRRMVSVKKPDGTLEQKEIKTGVNNSTMIEITEGLNEGDEVVSGASSRQNNLTPQQIEQMRQQFQQGARTNGGGAGFQGGGFPAGGGGAQTQSQSRNNSGNGGGNR